MKETQTRPSFSYYSNVLNKPFETLKELQEAEKAYHEANAAKEKAVEAKKADAKVVEDAWKHYLDVKAESYKAIKDAEDAYFKARQQFIDKYGSYHMTYSNNNGDVCLGVSDMVDTLFGNLFKYF